MDTVTTSTLKHFADFTEANLEAPQTASDLPTYFERLNDQFVSSLGDGVPAMVAAGGSAGYRVNVTTSSFKKPGGDYRPLVITAPGVYTLREDIVFDPSEQMLPSIEGDGYGDVNSPYFIGYFAAIIVAADNVIIDLNGHTIRQSDRYAMRQRFFSIVELGTRPFNPKRPVREGSTLPQLGFGGGGYEQNAPPVGVPAEYLVADPAGLGQPLVDAQGIVRSVFPSKVLITGGSGNVGVLGRSSHHGVHGNLNSFVRIEGVTIKHHEVAGISLNCAKHFACHDVDVFGLDQDPSFISSFSDDLDRFTEDPSISNVSPFRGVWASVLDLPIFIWREFLSPAAAGKYADSDVERAREISNELKAVIDKLLDKDNFGPDPDSLYQRLFKRGESGEYTNALEEVVDFGRPGQLGGTLVDLAFLLQPDRVPSGSLRAGIMIMPRFDIGEHSNSLDEAGHFSEDIVISQTRVAGIPSDSEPSVGITYEGRTPEGDPLRSIDGSMLDLTEMITGFGARTSQDDNVFSSSSVVNFVNGLKRYKGNFLLDRQIEILRLAQNRAGGSNFPVAKEFFDWADGKLWVVVETDIARFVSLDEDAELFFELLSGRSDAEIELAEEVGEVPEEVQGIQSVFSLDLVTGVDIRGHNTKGSIGVRIEGTVGAVVEAEVVVLPLRSGALADARFEPTDDDFDRRQREGRTFGIAAVGVSVANSHRVSVKARGVAGFNAHPNLFDSDTDFGLGREAMDVMLVSVFNDSSNVEVDAMASAAQRVHLSRSSMWTLLPTYIYEVGQQPTMLITGRPTEQTFGATVTHSFNAPPSINDLNPTATKAVQKASRHGCPMHFGC
jgi:hypothetical protein